MDKMGVEEVRALEQCYTCIHRRVCKVREAFKELFNAIEYQDSPRSANLKLSSYFKLQVPLELLDNPSLFTSVSCPFFKPK